MKSTRGIKYQRFFLLAFAAALDGVAMRYMNNPTNDRTDTKDPYLATSLCVLRLLICQVNWLRNKIKIFFNYHEESETLSSPLPEVIVGSDQLCQYMEVEIARY